MPWTRTGAVPDMTLVRAVWRIVEETAPRYWVLENVRGAMGSLGKPREIHGPFYLWGFFPSLGKPDLAMRRKATYTSARRADRAKIPYPLSLALALAIEQQQVLL